MKQTEAFVPRCGHDVFVSYAHVDNQRGWVTTLVKELEVRLGESLGRSRPSVWMDHQILGNEPLDQIISRIEKTAALLVICSPGYLRSEWCRKEIREFAKRYYGGDNRIFIAEVESIDWRTRAELLGDHPGYTFWIEDPATKVTARLGYPETEDQKIKYSKELNRMAQQLSVVLQAIAAEKGKAPPVQSKPRVFLAEVPDESLEPVRSEVEEALRQAGLAILPEDAALQNELERFTAWGRAVLPECKLFLQVLNEKSGKTRGRSTGLAVLQYRLALEAKTPIVQWRATNLDLNLVFDPEHRQLIESEYVRTCGIQELISEAISLASKKPATPFVPQGIGQWVFIDNDLTDREIAIVLRDWFKNRGFTVSTPLAKVKASEARRYLNDNLRGCDAALIVQGECAAAWVTQQLLYLSQQKAKRTKKLRGLGLCQTPPSDKDEIDFIPGDLVTLDGRNGLSPTFWAAVEAFTSGLQG